MAGSAHAGIDVTVGSTPIGVTTQYIGACEGNVNFDLADLTDLGINTYRIYGGMSRWESEDDDGVYGFPTIDAIKENPDVIPWGHWDQVMNAPESGSDYAFSGDPKDLWQGSAQTIFETLKQANIRPVLSIRNTDPGWNPDWALQFNPPRTEADWNEWWEHVFATVYWLNVRHDYRVDDFEVHNEPDNRQQGWGGSQNDYHKLIQVTSDAIAHVYATYLPGRTFHIHAPKTLGGSRWPSWTLAEVPTYFDSVNVHNYDWDISTYIRQVRHWMGGSVHHGAPLWIGEWGTYTEGYDDLDFSLNLLKNMVRMSQPETYVDGSHLFSLYDWGRSGDFEGLIDAEGDRRLSYYAFRMGVRALQGGHTVLPAALSNENVMAIAAQTDQTLNLLIINSLPTAQTVRITFPTEGLQPAADVREFSASALDEVVEVVDLEIHDMEAEVTISLPARSSRLVHIAR